MPRTWLVDDAPRHKALPAHAVSLLLGVRDDGAPGARMLAFLNEIVRVDYLSLVSYRPSGKSAAPRLIEGHCHVGAGDGGRSADPNGRNVTAECFAIYRQRYWQSDQATRIVEHLGAERAGVSTVTVLHCLPADIPVAAWRNEIYDRERLCGRLTFLYTHGPGQAYSINLYRREPLGAFRRGEVDRLLAVAPLLRDVHRQVLDHAALSAAAGATATDGSVAGAERALAGLPHRLSPRELQVCARIACGISADGIAADLGIAASTVVTLRKRAYAKLTDAGITGSRWHLMYLARPGRYPG